MQIFDFHIIGKPEPKGRPRFKKSGRAYTPAKTKKWERDVAIQAKGQVTEIITSPLSITLIFWLPRPNYISKSISWHSKKPDLDNLVKAVLDGLEGIIFKGDQQIARLTASKQYCGGNFPYYEPGVAIEIKTL